MFDSPTQEIRNSLPDLTRAFSAGQTIKVENGHWKVLGFFSRFVSWIKRESVSNLHQVITVINTLFDEVETGNSTLNVGHCRQAGKALYRRCRKAKPALLKLASADLKGRLLALYYRKHPPQEFNPASYQKILDAVNHWQSKNPLFSHCHLTDTDKIRLKEASCYPRFVQHLLNNKMERQRFFRWTIRHRNHCEPYILFRSTAEKLTDCNLSARIGYYGGEDLKVLTIDQRKLLTLRINGHDCNILDGHLFYTLEKDYRLSVDEILGIFRDRQTVIGNLEYFKNEGITNFNPKRLGPYNPETDHYDMIDLNSERWWEQLRPIETITAEEASRRFEDSEGNTIHCDGINWVATISATTDSLQVDATGNHAYFQMAIPTGDGHYRVYVFGKFTEVYPVTAEEKKKVAVEPVDAVIMYPDENIFNLDRFTESISWVLPPSEGISRMLSIRKDLQRVRDKNIAFQLFNGNCIMWCFHKMHRYVNEAEKRRLAGVRFVDAAPSGKLGYLWTIFRTIPTSWLEPSLNWFIRQLGGEKVFIVTKKNGSRVEKGLLKQVPWNPEAEFPHPGAFAIRKRDRKGALKQAASIN
jgi:hypothetical protein